MDSLKITRRSLPRKSADSMVCILASAHQTLNNVFEKLLASQLDQFYSEILSDYISAYRRHCSCETSLMRLTEDWRCSLDNKQIVAVISMDLSKAFDTIPHGLLLTKLKAYGVNSRSCSFLKITYTVGHSG